jgi:hypothetical protein
VVPPLPISRLARGPPGAVHRVRSVAGVVGVVGVPRRWVAMPSVVVVGVEPPPAAGILPRCHTGDRRRSLRVALRHSGDTLGWAEVVVDSTRRWFVNPADETSMVTSRRSATKRYCVLV